MHLAFIKTLHRFIEHIPVLHQLLVLLAKPSVLLAKPSVLLAKPSVLLAKPSVLLAKPSVLLLQVCFASRQLVAQYITVLLEHHASPLQVSKRVLQGGASHPQVGQLALQCLRRSWHRPRSA